MVAGLALVAGVSVIAAAPKPNVTAPNVTTPNVTTPNVTAPNVTAPNAEVANTKASNEDAANDSASTANWPGFRGPDGLGLAPADSTPPLQWTEKNILWKTEIEGRGHSSPIIWGNRVFLTTAIEGDVIPGVVPPIHTFDGEEFKHPDSMGGDRHHTMKVIALDTATGKVAWSRTAYAGRVFENRHKGSSYASPTPVTDGQRVYAYFGSEGVYAYDLAGNPVWQRDLGDIKSVGLGVGTSPVLYRNLLIIQADEDSGDLSFIIALDTTTGEPVWRKTRTVQASWGTPLLVEHQGKAQLLTSGNEHIIAYDPASGDEIWRAVGLEANAIHHPLLHGDLAIFTTGYPQKNTFAIRLGQRGDLGKDAAVWRYDKGTAYVPSNLLVDGRVYLLNDGGVVTCLDAATGKVIYEGGRFPTRGRFTASPVAVGDKILLISQDGDAAFIAAGPEFVVLAQSSLDEPVYATPAIVGDRVYVRGERHLFAIGPAK